MKAAGLVVLVVAAMAGCGSSPEVTPAADATVVREANSAVSSAATAADGDESVTLPSTMVPDTATGAPPEVPPDPDLGQFTGQAALIAALIASGPLDNQLPEATDGRMSQSCWCSNMPTADAKCACMGPVMPISSPVDVPCGSKPRSKPGRCRSAVRHPSRTTGGVRARLVRLRTGSLEGRRRSRQFPDPARGRPTTPTGELPRFHHRRGAQSSRRRA